MLIIDLNKAGCHVCNSSYCTRMKPKYQWWCHSQPHCSHCGWVELQFQVLTQVRHQNEERSLTVNYDVPIHFLSSSTENQNQSEHLTKHQVIITTWNDRNHFMEQFEVLNYAQSAYHLLSRCHSSLRLKYKNSVKMFPDSLNVHQSLASVHHNSWNVFKIKGSQPLDHGPVCGHESFQTGPKNKTVKD